MVRAYSQGQLSFGYRTLKNQCATKLEICFLLTTICSVEGTMWAAGKENSSVIPPIYRLCEPQYGSTKKDVPVRQLWNDYFGNNKLLYYYIWGLFFGRGQQPDTGTQVKGLCLGRTCQGKNPIPLFPIEHVKLISKHVYYVCSYL